MVNSASGSLSTVTHVQAKTADAYHFKTQAQALESPK